MKVNKMFELYNLEEMRKFHAVTIDKDDDYEEAIIRYLPIKRALEIEGRTLNFVIIFPELVELEDNEIVKLAMGDYFISDLDVTGTIYEGTNIAIDMGTITEDNPNLLPFLLGILSDAAYGHIKANLDLGVSLYFSIKNTFDIFSSNTVVAVDSDGYSP